MDQLHLNKPEPVPIVEVIPGRDDIIKMCKSDIECKTLAEVGYYEARGESDLGAAAVMTVVVNRTKHKKFPDKIVDVVREGCQFSYRCDNSRKKSKKEVDQWNRMFLLAYSVHVDGGIPQLSEATHYHSYAVNPFWSKKFKFISKIDSHAYYKCLKEC
jgi:spore germination cell wall hydrolase CwlJ-like protein